VKEARTKLPEGKYLFSSWRQMFHYGQPTHDIDHRISVVMTSSFGQQTLAGLAYVSAAGLS
jgi:hypothetical protein